MPNPLDDDIAEPAAPASRGLLRRRSLVLGGSALAATGVAGLVAGGLALRDRKPTIRYSASGLRKLNLAWNADAICLSPALYAKSAGIFEKNGLDVDLVNFAGSTDELLEAISTGKADAGVGMILRWIKPLEQGFDVKLVAGTHGGCIRMVGSRSAGITEDPASLRGKRIGISDVAGAARNAFAVLLDYHGINPNTEVDWRAYPVPLLPEAMRKGEVDAVADADPALYLLQKRNGHNLVEVLSNLSAPWDRRVCCVVGVAGNVLRHDKTAASALVLSLVEAASICSRDPDTVARLFAPYAKASVADLAWILRSQTHNHHPVGTDLVGEISQYATEFRRIGVLRQSTDPHEFANRVVENVSA